MTNIIRFDDFSNAEIRVTEDGRYSVFDLLKFCGKKNPSQVWNGDNRGNGLIDRYPELIHKVENLQFPGAGQRETPVATRENLLYILGLLPGAFGRAYREDAARVFIQYLDASPELAESIIDRANEKSLQRIEARLKSKKIRLSFTSTLQDHGVVGWQFGACTNAIYTPILGGTMKQVKQSRGLTKKDNLRDTLDEFELSQVMFAESLAKRKIEKDDLQGYQQCESAAFESAKKVKKISED